MKLKSRIFMGVKADAVIEIIDLWFMTARSSPWRKLA
jgi:hypothetical protein